MVKMLELDDSTYLEYHDRSGMLKLVESSPQLLIEGLGSKWTIEPREPRKKFSNVAIIGYGGSAISGDVLRNSCFRRTNVPIEVCRDLELPSYINGKTLVICISYSGETEELLKLLEESVKVGSEVVGITSGGTMSDFCRKLNLPLIRVRGGIPPRAALPLLFPALTLALSSFKVIGNMQNDIMEASRELEGQVSRLRSSVTSSANPCKRMALELAYSIPTIYSLERMSSVARRFKDQLNENSKIFAKFDLIPEACHNEIQGWSPSWLLEQPSSLFSVILIRDNKETLAESSRMEVLKKQIRSSGLERIYEVKTEAKTDLGGLLLSINFCDFVSVYLGLARGLDPTSIPAIEEFKERVGEKTRERERLKSAILG